MKEPPRPTRTRLCSIFAPLGLALAAGLSAVPLLAKHPDNPGPEDPPIRFPLPPPEPLSADDALKSFRLPPGFRIECVATEPMVEDPVAISFDADGRLWVVEMRGYMHDLDGGGEDQPTGRIKVLEDADGDGRMDRATVFLDGLYMPRAVLPTRGGALVAEPPELALWTDTDGDGKADHKTVVATDYGRRGGQPEVMANGLVPGLDNWIVSASHPARYRFRQGKWAAEYAPPRGQWGVSQDDAGRLYFCSNTDLARADLLPAHYSVRNPYYSASAFRHVELVADQQVWPSHPTPGVNRGYSAGELRDDGTLHNCTAACGIGVYRGDLFPPDFRGNLFTCEPAGNLVKRLVVAESSGKLAAKDAYERSDFLTSTDERFRPVNACTGPEGALYVVDLYRGVLQHTAYLTNYLIKNIRERRLEQPIHRGRIWRVVPEGQTPKPFKLPKDDAGLVAVLAHPNGWVRDTAQRVLVERHADAAVPLLEQTAADGRSALARLHALWTLEGMGKLDGPVALKALSDPDERVRAAAVRLTEPQLVPATRPQALPELLKLRADPSPAVQLQLALTLSAVPDPPAEEAAAGLLTDGTAAADLLRDAVLSGLRGRELEFAERLLASPAWSADKPPRAGLQAETLTALAQCVAGEHRGPRVRRLIELAAADPDGSWRQAALLRGLVPKGAAPVRRPATTAPTTNPTTAPAPPPSAVRVKLIYLDARPDALVTLLNNRMPVVRDLAARVDARLAWPGKAGVPPPPVVVPLTPEQQAQFDRGKAVFTQVCAACHQPTGLGQEGLAPPLLDSEWVLGPDRRAVRIVLHGLTGPVSVAGAPYNLEMPPLATMPDEEIAAALTYARREWEHAESPVRADTVRRVREETKARAEPWTAKELMQVK